MMTENYFLRKRVVVTAGADGIGLAIARAFYDEGAFVHICSRTEEKLKARADEMQGLLYTKADVSDYYYVEKLFADAERKMGGVDILVNNAGVAGPTAPVHKITQEEWRLTMATNIDAQFYCVKFAAPLMIKSGGGAIINIGSTASLFAYPNRAPYAASKWAVIGLTKTLALELGGYGIRANAICPGCVEGERIDGVIEREAAALGVSCEQVRAGYVKGSALKTFINARDIADMCLYLASPSGAKISGQAITIDGFTENCHS